ncbi:DUF4156 domain-containing protein [Candidatus Pelagadaptatus aseana]|uniref:DUF4156 domain-containing protein n=1 Tax=Candidatus Pelagadaptatus aseana TaxID=3120508 RepID=UPI003C6F4642
MSIKTIYTLGLTALVSACAWVDSKPGSEQVVMLDRFQAESCQRLGTTSTQTKDKLWLYERDQQTVRNELVALARNEAAAMGGNALVPEQEATDGQQQFIIYRCP